MLAAFLGPFLLLSDRCFAGPYDRIASQVSGIARRSGKRRIAVLPFAGLSGGRSESGPLLYKRVTDRLADEGGVTIVERNLLEKALKERRLGHEGRIDPRQVMQAGRLLGVDAILVGTYAPLPRDRIELNLMLIDVKTARVLGASSQRVPKKRQEDPMAAGFSWIVPPPRLESAGPHYSSSGHGEAWGRRMSGGCAGWEGKIDALQEGVVELKARYWASRLRDKDFSPRRSTRNPGSDIRDIGLRQRFYGRLRRLYGQGYVGGVSRGEAQLIGISDRAVRSLRDHCHR